MGTLYYGDNRFPIPVDDRALAHLEFTIMSKLRRAETFSYSWVFPRQDGTGRSSVWMHPAIPIQFEFEASQRPALNRRWLEALSRLAASNSGLTLVDEPAEETDNAAAAAEEKSEPGS